ncbi:ribosomal RNA-processing protein 8 [Rhodotorula diobovata]|uniref:Ribosomal RNA-processing protein 8 n=1 Tax=Rhodotorula diobovata TaxID=5288 RepID=A0A5C5G6P3_9BASI|nr:ribosomal RNA-processing protein 8 [Rhodotorula diobovata]
MLFDTPLLNLSAKEPVASTAGPSTPASAKKRKRSSSNAAAHDGPAPQPAGQGAALPAAEINLDKLMKRMKAGAAAATSSADEPAALSDSPAPPKPVSAAVAQLAQQRRAVPSQVVTASTAGKSGSMQDKLRAQLAGGKFRMLNEQLYTTSGDDAHALMQEEGAFDDYHIGFRSQAATWPVHPLALIAQALLSSLPANALIADFGCGDAALARTLCPSTSPAAATLPPMPSLKVPAKVVAQKQLKVASFDLLSQSSFVVEAECSSVPLPGGTAGGEIVDAVVCCLSLMGTDWIRMVREAKRVLKDGGVLKIAEVTSRFTSVDEFVKLVNALGFTLSHKDDSNTHFLLLDFTKKSGADAVEDANKAGERTRKAATLLNPCIYKRR